MRLNVWACALASGILWGAGLCLITWWLILWDGPSQRAYILGHIYRGWSPTPLGSLWGLLWGFGDGLLGGAVFAWLYNALATPRRPRSAPYTPPD